MPEIVRSELIRRYGAPESPGQVRAWADLKLNADGSQLTGQYGWLKRGAGSAKDGAGEMVLSRPAKPPEPEDSPNIQFLIWDTWEREDRDGAEWVWPVTRLPKDVLRADRPFEVEVFFEEDRDDEEVPVKLSGGAAPLTLAAKRTEDPKFFRALLDDYLDDYLNDPSPAEAKEDLEELGEPLNLATRAWLRATGEGSMVDKAYGGLPVPKNIRDRYKGMPERLLAAVKFWQAGSESITVLDTPFLLGPENTGKGMMDDVKGGGRNLSNTMHWATGMRYSDLPEGAMREMFIGYELYHLEGWDVFGQDALNDLIAEEQGRLFGAELREGYLETEAELATAADEAFMESRAWVGRLLKMRQDELDRAILAEEQLDARHWWNSKSHVPPFSGLTIGQMADRGHSLKELKELKESKLVKHVIETYELLYWADVWEKGPENSITLTDATRDMVQGKYDSQFKAAPEEWDSAWDLDSDAID